MKRLLGLVVACMVVILANAPVSAGQGAERSQIDGDYEGWNGNTIYQLVNGEIWKQMVYHYHYHYAFEPKVFIYKDKYGLWRMHVDEDDDDEDPVVERVN